MKIVYRYKDRSGRLIECGNLAGRSRINGRPGAVKCRKALKQSNRRKSRRVRRSRRSKHRS